MESERDIITISSLIQLVQMVREKRGDLRVYVLDADERFTPVQDIRLETLDIPHVGEREIVVITA